MPADFLTCTSTPPLLQTVLQCDPVNVLVNTPEEVWDPNTLLATLSQASAVLVAIIGGFLVSRLVAISSERAGVRRLLEATGSRITHITEDLRNTQQARINKAQDEFHDQAVRKFLDKPNDDLDKVIHELVPQGTTPNELRPYAIALKKKTAQTLADIEDWIKPGDTTNLKLENLLNRGLVVAAIDRKIYEAAFEHRRKRLPAPTALALFTSAAGSYDPLTFARTPDWVHDRNARLADEALRAEADLMAQLKLAEAERDRLNGELVRTGNPIGVRSAIWMLGILSVLGILIPVVVMAFEPKALEVGLKIGLLVSFVLGLAAILFYVNWFSRSIRASIKGSD